MHDYALRLAGDACVAVGHGEGHHFVGACYDAGELALLLNLAFGNGFDDGGMVGAKVDEAVGHTQFPKRLKEGIAGGVPGPCVSEANDCLLTYSAYSLVGYEAYILTKSCAHSRRPRGQSKAISPVCMSKEEGGLFMVLYMHPALASDM